MMWFCRSAIYYIAAFIESDLWSLIEVERGDLVMLIMLSMGPERVQ